MIKYLIVDDEYIAHDIIKGYCARLQDMQLVKSCYDALEAFEYLNSNKVDLIFLDLNMPVLKGFEFLRTLKNPPKVIVTTAYQEFAIEGYELNIADYLLKPFSFERFLKAINKSFGNATITDSASTQTSTDASRIFIQSNKKHIQLNTDHLLYIEATGNYTRLVTASEVITIRAKFSDVLRQLPKSGFIQVHKSFAVAPKHIRSIEGNIITIAEYFVPIGKMYRSNIDRLLK